MTKSKAWDWNQVQGAEENFWRNPDMDAYYLATRWNKQGKSSVLDLGAGLGRHAIFFAKNNFKTTAFDLSEDGIEYAQNWANAEKLDISFKTGDMLSLPYEDNIFDAIICYNVVSHQDTNGVKKAISEMHRVLKPEGEIYLTLCSKQTYGWQQDWPKVDANTKIRMDDGPEKGVPHFYADEEILPEILKGFTVIQMAHTQQYWKDLSAKEAYSPVEGLLGITHGGWHYHILMKKS